MKTIRFERFSLVVIICLGASLAQAAYAQERAADNDAWEFRIGIPVWAAGARGTVGVDGRAAHVNDDFWDLLDTLDFTAALNLEIRKSRFLFFLDGEYVKTSTTGEPRGLFGGSSVDLNQKLNFNDVAIGYALVKTECFSLEVFAGAQLTFLQPDLTLELPVADRTASTSKFWADPIVGAYIHYPFSRPVGLYVKGDAGGFDVSSRLTWQVEGGFDFPICRNFYARLAYRYLSVDYHKGSVLFDMAMHGPQLEIGARF